MTNLLWRMVKIISSVFSTEFQFSNCVRRQENATPNLGWFKLRLSVRPRSRALHFILNISWYQNTEPAFSQQVLFRSLKVWDIVGYKLSFWRCLLWLCMYVRLSSEMGNAFLIVLGFMCFSSKQIVYLLFLCSFAVGKTRTFPAWCWVSFCGR